VGALELPWKKFIGRASGADVRGGRKGPERSAATSSEERGPYLALRAPRIGGLDRAQLKAEKGVPSHGGGPDRHRKTGGQKRTARQRKKSWGVLNRGPGALAEGKEGKSGQRKRSDRRHHQGTARTRRQREKWGNSKANAVPVEKKGGGGPSRRRKG